MCTVNFPKSANIYLQKRLVQKTCPRSASEYGAFLLLSAVYLPSLLLSSCLLLSFIFNMLFNDSNNLSILWCFCQIHKHEALLSKENVANSQILLANLLLRFCIHRPYLNIFVHFPIITSKQYCAL